MELYQLIDKAPEKEKKQKTSITFYCANWGNTICALYSS